LLIRPGEAEESARAIAEWVGSEAFGEAGQIARRNVARWNTLASADAGRLLALLDGDPRAYAEPNSMIP
jgi:hypothetical protein